MLRGLAAELPVGPNGGIDGEVCLDAVTLPVTDGDLPAVGAAFWYLVRARNFCGPGTWGYASATGAPIAERHSPVCP